LSDKATAADDSTVIPTPRRPKILSDPAGPQPLPPPPPPPPIPWMDAIKRQNLEDFKVAVSNRVSSIISKHNMDNYDVLFLYDDIDLIQPYHSDHLYKAAKLSSEKGKDILLIIHSRGGRIEPAYVIGKTLKRLSAKKFSVAVPRKAKSAATLISLGADEIHMGMISELGPIDPQIGDMPALALENALEVIADMAERYPAASDMLGKYISDQAPLRVLGYLKRVTESASQYAERLLAGKTVGENHTIASVADHLVNHYKDHSFVIDAEEARMLLGDEIIRENSPEYKLADELYEFLDLVKFRCGRSDLLFWLVGSADKAAWRASANEP